MSKNDFESYVHSIISSKLDYCNVVLYGINKSVVYKLQMLQDAAARLIFKLPKHCSVSDAIRQLHWLRVEERIIFKIILFVYKFFTSNGPAFLDKILEIVDVESRLLKRKNLNTKYLFIYSVMEVIFFGANKAYHRVGYCISMYA